MPFIRRIGNLGLSFLTKLASGYWDIFDPTNGYTAIRASIVPLLDLSSIARRYFFETSMLLELSFLRAAVKDVFIPARYGDEVSQLSVRRSLLEFPLALFRGFLRRVWVQYFVRDFDVLSLYLIVGMLAVAFGTSFGLYHWISHGYSGTQTPIGTVMLAALFVILGVQFLLQTVVLDIQAQPREAIYPELEWNPLPGKNPADANA